MSTVLQREYDGHRCTPLTSEERTTHHAFGATNCLVCGSDLTYWAERLPSGPVTHAVTCEACGLIEYRKMIARCGWNWAWGRSWADSIGAYAAMIAETKRLYADPDEKTIRPDNAIDRTHWLIYADWLEEHNYPLNGRGVRDCYANPTV